MARERQCDVLVVGAGPAGLTAAVYLARYRRDVLVVHDDASRAARIPLTHNVPGFPEGISGPELLSRMSEQAELYGAQFTRDAITSARRDGDGFAAEGAGARYAARAVIFATGVTLNQVDLPHEAHEEAIRLGCLRYCPICDGYEATGKKVAVVGSDKRGGQEALFLRQFTDKVTLLPRTASDLSADQRAELAGAGVTVIEEAVEGLAPGREGMTVRTAGGHALTFDVLYPALGSQPRSELAAQLGVPLSAAGCVLTTANQELAVPGAFAAGDVVEALDQISVAVGHGAVAATRAHNFLRARDGHVVTAE